MSDDDIIRRQELVDQLTDAFGAVAAAYFIERIAPMNWHELALKTDTLALKADLDIVRVDLDSVKSDVAVLKTDVAVLKTDVCVLKLDMHDVKAELASFKFEVRSDFRHVDEMAAVRFAATEKLLEARIATAGATTTRAIVMALLLASFGTIGINMAIVRILVR